MGRVSSCAKALGQGPSLSKRARKVGRAECRWVCLSQKREVFFADVWVICEDDKGQRLAGV